MAFKLLEAAETRWRAVNGPHLVPLVRAGATFEEGVLVERAAEARHHRAREGRRVINSGRAMHNP